MMNKKLYSIILSALILGLFSGCGTEPTTSEANKNGNSDEQKTENPEDEKVAVDFQPMIETKEVENGVTVTYKVKNISGENQKLTFTSGLKADFIVYDLNGKKIKQHSDEVSSTQAIQEVTLEVNETIENEFMIPELYNGQFKIEVFLTAIEAESKIVSDLVIENSIYSKGYGELVGQMDPHTVEIKVDGNATAFQLTELAQQQLTSIQDGDEVAFIYTESEIEQKTIEQFLIETE